MSKNKKYEVKKKEKKEKNPVLIPSIVLLVIMILSMFGFALSGSGGSSNTNSGSDLPLGQHFQNPNTGEIYYGAIKNSEQFVFFTIDGYELAEYEKNLAANIKSKSSINIYLDSNFESSNARYLIEKSLRANKIDFTYINDISVCNNDILILTTNSSSYQDSSCLKFIASNDEAEERANILVYHMIK